MLIALVVSAGILLFLFLFLIAYYNKLVRGRNLVEEAWSGISVQLKRRHDLIPSLVNTVKGYAQHESAVLREVTEARAKATQITVDPSRLTPEKLKEYQATQGELSAALGKLIAVQENYPQLKADQHFSDLQAQLEGTENRINESRTRYNEAVQSYNLKVRQFPINLLAKMMGFEQKTKFEAQSGAEKAPEVKF